MFSHAKTLFRIFGLEVRVDPSWFLIAALITWSLWRHVFPASLPGLSEIGYGAMAVAGMLLFFASLVLHELAHALTGRLHGVDTNAITLFLFGGVAELASDPRKPADEFLIALAGPAMSFVLAAVFWFASVLASSQSVNAAVVEVLGYLGVINLVLAVFNLLPAFPLDGGRVVRAWLWHRSGDVMAATETAGRLGAILAYGLIVWGVVSLSRGFFVGGLWQIMIGMFVLSASRGSVESQRVKVALQDKTVAEIMTSHPVVASPKMTLAELVNRTMLGQRVSFVPVLEGDRLLGHIDAGVLSEIDREYWANTRVGDIYVNLNSTAVIAPDLPVLSLLDTIARTGQRKFMVVEAGALLGVVTLADLTRYMTIISELGHGSATLHARRQ